MSSAITQIIRGLQVKIILYVLGFHFISRIVTPPAYHYP